MKAPKPGSPPSFAYSLLLNSAFFSLKLCSQKCFVSQTAVTGGYFVEITDQKDDEIRKNGSKTEDRAPSFADGLLFISTFFRLKLCSRKVSIFSDRASTRRLFRRNQARAPSFRFWFAVHLGFFRFKLCSQK